MTCRMVGLHMNQKYQLFRFMSHLIQNTEYRPKWIYEKEPFQETDTLHDLKFWPSFGYGISPMQLNHLFMTFAERYNLHGMLVVKHGKCIFEKYAAPYRKNYRHVSYSMCKTVTGMAVGLAIDDQKLSYSTKLCDLFPSYMTSKTPAAIRNITIYHLLTMQAGVCFHELTQTFSDQWVRSYLQADSKFAPGTDFYYNSMHSYMLCAALKQVYHKPVMDLIRERLLNPMDIYDITWDTCPSGIEKGGYGMKLSLHDMAKFGLLYLNHGTHIDAISKRKYQLLSPDYVNMATTKQCTTNHPGFDYGFQCWIMEDGYLFNGMLGQNVYVFPEQDMIIATQGGSACFLPDEEMMQPIRSFVYQQKIQKPQSAFIPVMKAYKDLSMLDNLLGKTFHFPNGVMPVMPFFMQLFYQQMMPDITRIRFYRLYPNSEQTDTIEMSHQHFNIDLYDIQNCYTLRAVTNGVLEQHILIGSNRYPLSVACTVSIHQLVLRIDFLEEANSRIYTFTTSQNGLCCIANELPTLEFFSEAILKKDILPDKINKILKPDSYGFENS